MDSISSIAAPGLALIHSRSDDTARSGTMLNLLIALMVLVFVSLLLTGALFAVRKIRRSRAIARQQLPSYSEPNSCPISNHRRLTIFAEPYHRASSVYVYNEKTSMISSPTTPSSPVPEIRITFPDEHDESGRPKSGRMVIVRVGENGVGLEPVQDEQLPAYEKETGGGFQSIDMDRIGGLKEKVVKDQYS